jgi:hypothetical protein
MGEGKKYDGPNFLQRLIGKEIMIEFVDYQRPGAHEEGESQFIGILRGYNRYELLIDVPDDELMEIHTVVVMKHAVAMISPVKENPFIEEKKEHVDGVPV